jgi:hypothetical protein
MRGIWRVECAEHMGSTRLLGDLRMALRIAIHVLGLPTLTKSIRELDECHEQRMQLPLHLLLQPPDLECHSYCGSEY